MSNASSEITTTKPSKPKMFGGPIRIVLTTLLIFAATQILALLVAGAFAAIFTSDPLGSSIENSVATQFIYIVIAEASILGSVWFVLQKRQLSFKDIGFSRWPGWGDLWLALLSFVGFVISLIVVVAIITSFWHGYNTDQLQDVGFKTINSSFEKFVAFICLVLLPPIGEETLMRGYLFTGLRSRWNFVTAGLFTSFFFGAAHLLTGQSGLLWAAAVDTFVLSLFLVYLRERTGALYAGMGLHALNNVLAFFVYFHS